MEISNPLHSGRWFGWVPVTLRTLWTLSVICMACSHVLQFQSSIILSKNLQDLVHSTLTNTRVLSSRWINTNKNIFLLVEIALNRTHWTFRTVLGLFPTSWMNKFSVLCCDCVFHSSDLNAKGCVHQAFEMYRLKSCIDFKPYEGEKTYIKFEKRGGYVCSPHCCCRVDTSLQLQYVGKSKSKTFWLFVCWNQLWPRFKFPEMKMAEQTSEQNFLSLTLFWQLLLLVIGVSPRLVTNRPARFCLWVPAVTTRLWLNMNYSTLWDFTTNSPAQTGMTTLTSGWIRFYQVCLLTVWSNLFL